MSRPHQGTQPAVVKQQYEPDRVWEFENHWRSELFNCKPWGQCCLFCFCGCCMGCKLSKRMGESAIIGCLPCAFPYFRTKLRTARRIEGGCCGDFCATHCCMPCAGNQLANELESQGLWDTQQKTRKTHPKNDRMNQNNGDY